MGEKEKLYSSCSIQDVEARSEKKNRKKKQKAHKTLQLRLHPLKSPAPNYPPPKPEQKARSIGSTDFADIDET